MITTEELQSAKPTLFGTSTLKAILSGRQCETRAVIEPQPKAIPMYSSVSRIWTCPISHTQLIPPCEAGDILWIREPWLPNGNKFTYRTDASEKDKALLKWNSAASMPPRAARFYLRVDWVRANRLQDINYDGCKAQGINDSYLTRSDKYAEHLRTIAYRDIFAEMWDSHIKPENLETKGWEADPWVWIMRFSLDIPEQKGETSHEHNKRNSNKQ